jgi:hypothetical protein
MSEPMSDREFVEWCSDGTHGILVQEWDRLRDLATTMGQILPRPTMCDLATLRLDLADTLRERDQTKSEFACAISNLSRALFPGSPKASAEAEFYLDAMGACQAIERMRRERDQAREQVEAAREKIKDLSHDPGCYSMRRFCTVCRYESTQCDCSVSGSGYPPPDKPGNCNCLRSRALAALEPNAPQGGTKTTSVPAVDARP